jgi:hypothetical protein
MQPDKQQDVFIYEKVKYRRWDLEKEGYDRQDLVYHYLIDLKHLAKIYYKNSWWFAIKRHTCHIHCEDSGDTTTPLGYNFGGEANNED